MSPLGWILALTPSLLGWAILLGCGIAVAWILGRLVGWIRVRRPTCEDAAPGLGPQPDAYSDGYRAGLAAGEERGYARGPEAGLLDGQRAALPPHLVRDALRLCHPDLHPPERAALAHRVSLCLIERLPRREGRRAA